MRAGRGFDAFPAIYNIHAVENIGLPSLCLARFQIAAHALDDASPSGAYDLPQEAPGDKPLGH